MKQAEAVKHTPGPWRLVDCRHQKGGQLKLRSRAPQQYHWIANILALGSNAEADARLIAAAPDLLEAARQTVALLYDFPGVQMHDAREALAAAIHKAEGAA